MDRNMTITHPPERTSFGAVSMQLRVAAKYLGVDPNNLSFNQQRGIIDFLSSDEKNLLIVGRHLCDLIACDFGQAKLCTLTDEQIRIVATRYNRGAHLSLEKIKQNTHYGDRVLEKKHHVIKLLN